MNRIALVDDHHLMRNALATMINGIEGYTVCLEAGNGRELIDALDVLQPPAIAVIDLNMPVMDGYETIAWLREHQPGILPLALTFDPADDAMVKAVKAGARGFLRKNARPPLLKLALDTLMVAGYFHTEEEQQVMRHEAGLRTRKERERERVLEQITPRELEFIRHVCAANEPTYDQIASAMGVQFSTVDGYRNQLFAKFQIRSKTGLVLFAMRWGLVPF